MSQELKPIQQFNDNDYFLSLNVYKFPLGNCGGITDHVQTIWVPCAEGYRKFADLDKSLIFIPEQRGRDYWALKPLMQPTGLVGPMAGGNLAYSGDSRNTKVYHIHDRFETQQTYDALSR